MLNVFKNIFGYVAKSGIPYIAILKFSAILALIIGTNWLTLKVAEGDFDKERMKNLQSQLQTEKLLAVNYQNDIQRMQDSLSKASEQNNQLAFRMQKLIKEHNNAPPLPIDCTIDDAGVQFITEARSNALQVPSDPSSTTTHSSVSSE